MRKSFYFFILHPHLKSKMYLKKGRRLGDPREVRRMCCHQFSRLWRVWRMETTSPVPV